MHPISMKTDLQPNISVKNPPEIGPTSGIGARTMYKYEYILAPWFTENRSLIADLKIIIVEATARPWNRRSIYSGSGLVISDERNEDNINTNMPPRMTGRRPKRSDKGP